MAVEAPECLAQFRVAFRQVRCTRPWGHPGPHACIEAGATRIDRTWQPDPNLRERLLREEWMVVEQ